MKKYRLRVGLDVDDTLYACNDYALSIINARYPDEPPISLEDITRWGNHGKRADERIALYGDPEFVRSQPILPGAQEFVRELCKIADVFFVTAIAGQCMTPRVERLLKDFPEVPAQNIIIGSRKDVMVLDILLDDGAHNISSSRAAYPVLLRRPWNQHLSGLLAVNSYDDFLHFCNMTVNSFIQQEPNLSQGGIICLVGPSGSKKNEIANILASDPKYAKPITYTTRERRVGESEDQYRFVTREQFLAERDKGAFIETTVYSKRYFGMSGKSVEDIVNSGKIAVIPIDICGAITLKNVYQNKCMLVFTRRDKSAVVLDIVSRNADAKDKTRRIMSLEYEYRNAEICDVEVDIGDDAVDGARQIEAMIASHKDTRQ